MSLELFLTVFGAIGGVAMAWLIIVSIVHVTRLQTRREFRHYLSITSVIYNPNDWM